MTPWTAVYQASLSFTISRSLLKRMSMESVMPSNHLVLCCPFLLLHKIPASACFLMSQLLPQEAKVLELQLLHQSFNDYSGLISFRIDWFDLLAVQGTLESLLQHHSLKASILQPFLLSRPSMNILCNNKKNLFLCCGCNSLPSV